MKEVLGVEIPQEMENYFCVSLLEFLQDYDKCDYKIMKCNLRHIREEKGLTPMFFEKTVGIKAEQYVQFEKLAYKFKIRIDLMAKICFALRIDMSELLVVRDDVDYSYVPRRNKRKGE